MDRGMVAGLGGGGRIQVNPGEAMENGIWNMEKLAIPGNPAKSDRIRPVLVTGLMASERCGRSVADDRNPID